MAFLLDTNHCIYLLNGLEKAKGKQQETERCVIEKVQKVHASLFMCEVTLGELIYGAACSKRKEHNLTRIERLKQAVMPLELTEAMWEKFGLSKAKLRQKGRAMGDLDLLIACCASVHNVVLVTNDSDFDHLPFELERVNWVLP